MKFIGGERIPYELQDHIIAQLEGDGKTLATCSLISSRWFERSRSLMDISLVTYIERDGYIPPRAMDLITLLDAPHSTLGRFIQKVSILGPDVAWISLEEFDRGSKYAISQEAKHQLGSLSSLLTITWIEVNFDTLADLVQFTGRCFRNLRGLRIDRLRLDKGSESESSISAWDPNTFSSLRALTLLGEDTTAPFFSSSSTIFPVHNIDTLYLTLRLQYVSGPYLLRSILDATAPNLSALTLDTSPCRSFSYPISLSQMVKLRCLRIATKIDPSLVEWFTETLDSNSKTSKLEVFCFCIHERDLEDLDFPSIERALLGLNASIITAFLDNDHGTESPLAEKVIQGMPRLSMTGRLRVKALPFEDDLFQM
ncbi:hypothetical protein J132_03809 [Termitomyces sp. J132]|nr:hypothetical protein J132_03809 [Termitomyces sp. J132]